MNKKLELKSISEILSINFFIPAYQRGYRWDSRQVIDLLEDIYDFAKKKERNELETGEFYCLQPVVIKNKTTESKSIQYKVIDGQQRLTTLLIIMKYLESKIKEDYYIESLYTISYETRQETNNNSFDFLQNINAITAITDDNIDFYYMSKAYLTTKHWFVSNKVNKGDFLNVLLKHDKQDEKDLANNIRFIWYEVDDENEIDAFTRLNIGKIPLTNSELIKALFLINTEDESEKILLASQWDEIEYKLQNKEFFSFIYNGDFKKPTKIEYIFDLIANSKNLTIDNLREDENKRSYYIFNALIRSETDTKILWAEVKTYFRIFNELYHDNTYYHLVGYLVYNNFKIKNIIDYFINNDKDEFLIKLNKQIINIIKTDKNIMLLSYKKDTDKITKILFLFNIISMSKSEYSRYPFNKHNNWSLEHIHAQNSEEITENQDKRMLLEDDLKYASEELQKKINQLLNNSEKISDDEFSQIQNELSKKYGDGANVHTIDNLALLKKDDNTSLSNKIFPAKRDKIQELDKKGSFIPIGTKNVFLKYYSINVKEAITWNQEDRNQYLKAIQEMLKEYIGEGNE